MTPGKLLQGALAGLSALTFVCCAGTSGDEREPTHYVLFLDLSGSIADYERDQWTDAANRLIAQLEGGDAVTLFPIHDRTLDAAPLYQDRIRRCARDPTIGELRACRSSLESIRAEALSRLDNALAESIGSQQTDLFAAVERCAAIRAPEGGRRTCVFFSDMLHSTRALDLETKRLTPEGLPSLLEDLARQYSWRPNQLTGTTVVVILGSARSGDREPVNSTVLLRHFWRTVFNALGAELESFDTYLPRELFTRGGRR